MTLLNVPEGAVVDILTFEGGGLTRRLSALGFFSQSRIRLVKAAPFRGPLLIEDVATGSRIMIGRGMADKIKVCHDDPARP